MSSDWDGSVRPSPGEVAGSPAEFRRRVQTDRYEGSRMLEKASALKGYSLNGLDGDIGNVRDLYFDDRYWTVRYLLADTGGWLSGKQVLISPGNLSSECGHSHRLSVELTKAKIKESPYLEPGTLVSQQLENSRFGYLGWPMYYPHLRNTKQMSDCSLAASDGEIGQVQDLLIDSGTWTIRYLVIDTRNSSDDKYVVVAPEWIDRVSWKEAKVFTSLSSASIKPAPEYQTESPPTREYEEQLHRYYGRQGYWTAGAATSAA